MVTTTRRLARSIGTAAATIALTAPLGSAPAGARPAERSTAVADPSGVVWSADFERGDLGEWDGMQRVDNDRLQVVGAPVRSGRHAVRALVRQGDDPIDASGNRAELVKMTDEAPGSEYFYRWSTLFPKDFPSEKHWQLFTQWHQEADTGSPPVEFYAYGEEIRLNIGGDPGTLVWRAPLVRERWHDFVFHVRWSADAEVGFVELYYDGRLVLPRRQIATQFTGMRNYLKVGLYRDEAVEPDGVVYHDGWVMGRTLASVWPSGPVTAPRPPEHRRTATRVMARLSTSSVRRARTTRLDVRMRPRAVRGRVVVLVDGRRRRLLPLHHGRAHLRVGGRWSLGRHAIRVLFRGSARFEPSASRILRLRVRRAR